MSLTDDDLGTRLRDLAAAAAMPDPDPDRDLARGRRRLAVRRLTAAGGALVTAGVIGGVGLVGIGSTDSSAPRYAGNATPSSVSSSGSSAEPSDPTAGAMDGHPFLSVDPRVVSPGQEVALTVGGVEERGERYTLKGTAPGDYFTLFAAIGGHGTAAWFHRKMADTEVGHLGPGPDLVVIPDIAKPGPYQLCGEVGASRLCVDLTVTATDATAH